jgi:transposase InsO family protein
MQSPIAEPSRSAASARTHHRVAAPSGAIRVDNSPECITEKLKEWACKRNISLQHIQPGQPQQNANIVNKRGNRIPP